MIRKTKHFSPIFTLVILSFLFGIQACLAPSCKDQGRPESIQQVRFSVKAFEIDSLDVWGYEILVNRKVYIHQEFIPALEGIKRFETKEQALRVGKAVLKKMKNNQNPALTREEVEGLLKN